MPRPVDPRELSRLNRALGLGGAGDHIGRLAIAVFVIMLTVAALGVVTIPIGEATEAYGVVETLGFTETDTGSKPYANVRLGDRSVRVRLSGPNLCRAGDRILVRRQRTLFGQRHRMAPAGCARPAAS